MSVNMSPWNVKHKSITIRITAKTSRINMEIFDMDLAKQYPKHVA